MEHRKPRAHAVDLERESSQLDARLHKTSANKDASTLIIGTSHKLHMHSDSQPTMSILAAPFLLTRLLSSAGRAATLTPSSKHLELLIYYMLQ